MSSRFTATCIVPSFILFFFFNDTATTEIYTLSLHDALPISAYLRRKLFRSLSEFWKPPSPTAMLSQQFVQIYAPSFRAWPLLPRIELPPEIRALVGVPEAYESGDESAFWNFVNEWFIRGVTGRRADFHQQIG